MTETEIELRLVWENGVAFTMTSKENDGAILTITKVSENGHLDALWNSIQKVGETYIKGVLTRIGTEMKA